VCGVRTRGGGGGNTRTGRQQKVMSLCAHPHKAQLVLSARPAPPSSVSRLPAASLRNNRSHLGIEGRDDGARLLNQAGQ
jgi:hypothetical protein